MSLPPLPSCPLTQSHPTSAGLLGPCHPNRSDSSPCPRPLSGLSLRELPAGRLTPSPLELMSVTPGKFAVCLVSLSSLPMAPRHHSHLAQTVTEALEPQPLAQAASPIAPFFLGLWWWAGRWGECRYACMVCCPVVWDSKPCETWSLGVTPGCSKCLFMCEVGERAEGGQSVLLWFIWRVNLAEPDTPRGRQCRNHWFPNCGGICTFVCF